jgi:hypothetical protein
MAGSRPSATLTVLPQGCLAGGGNDTDRRARLRDALIRVGSATVCAMESLGRDPSQAGDLRELQLQLQLAREALGVAEALTREDEHRAHKA